LPFLKSPAVIVAILIFLPLYMREYLHSL